MKQINLTQGMIALVDDEDFDFLNQWKWHAKVNGKKRNGFYAVRSFHFRKSSGEHTCRTVFMHRVLMGVDDKSYREIEVDHIDHNGLNNTKINLRKSSRSQNCINRRKNNIKKYRGVTKLLSGNFQATIKINQKSLSLGAFKNIDDAAKAYDSKAKELFGQFAILNLE